MIIVDFQTESSILRDARTAAPDVTLRVESERRTADCGIKLLFWASGESLDRFEAAMETDPTVDSFTTLSDEANRRLYSVRYSETGEEAAATNLIAELGVVVTKVVATANGLQAEMQFPGREALRAFQEWCRSREQNFQIRTLYKDTDDSTVGHPFDLTAAQKEALTLAYELGYFDIPRQASLQDVADELDISDQALSERLRRAIAKIVENSEL
ncbi:MAG: helix-turn-helix domain-containing protein [Halobacteriota archaeon]